ncbi:MAG TPA: hypothetical protein VG755_06515, partial [Nannocystaceae bacterium]|nr:hypothetical protein [Nannocystaceae bacterium]
MRRLPAWRDAFRAVASAPGGIAAMHRVIRYLELVLSERRFARVRGMLVELGSETKEAVVTYSDRVFAEGKAEGKAEGRAEAQREMLLELLATKFGTLQQSVVDRVR